MNKQSMVGGLMVIVAAVFFAGCGGSDPKSMIADANDMNVKRLATAYSFYHLKNRFKGPKNEAEFKKFISEQDAARMELAGIDVSDVDSLFVSERDSLPLIIRYGLDTKVRGPSLPIVFEDKGVEGLRHVGFTNGSMQEVDAAKYKELFGGKHDKDSVDENRG